MARILSPTAVAAIGLAILAFAAPGRAHAEVVDPDTIDPIAHPLIEDEPPAPTPSPDISTCCQHEESRWERARIAASAGIRFGNFTINGDSSGTAIPFHLDLGLRRDRWLVYASYDVFGVSAHVPAPSETPRTSALTDLGDGSGLAHRLGASARYAVGRFGESDGGLELWTEGGLGVQHLRWDAGGTWTRPDLSLGLGATVVYLGKRQHAGLSIGLRVMIAPRNDTDNAPPTCGGPCDTATPPSSYDRSFLFDISLPFGT